MSRCGFCYLRAARYDNSTPRMSRSGEKPASEVEVSDTGTRGRCALVDDMYKSF
jgi:hypothetical protein